MNTELTIEISGVPEGYFEIHLKDVNGEVVKFKTADTIVEVHAVIDEMLAELKQEGMP